MRDISRLCYPKELIQPPAVELTIAERGGQTFLVSPTMAKNPEATDHIKHVINLFLELFRECELVADNMEDFDVPAVERVNWRLLPPGQYPWEVLRPHMELALRRTSEAMQKVIKDRQDTIRAYNPDRIYVGAGGFGDYLAYEFERFGSVVLESVRVDNAIYAFGQDWQAVSQLSKAQVINGNHHQARIVHSDGWKDRLAHFLQ
ncbi:hypothetical protein [Phyllobacterium chamaecytisi]|uniref:hypothetical protein n=1 Tax=Phyllobacterium chamaecytisi TaxID=2876082 RepID=UPI001CCFE70C|nr:hypothetical protein [Phyllobacterium sp. KW56]MBZ9603951.1 hypothetical protein [Phyllobacterium sp. KW56]